MRDMTRPEPRAASLRCLSLWRRLHPSHVRHAVHVVRLDVQGHPAAEGVWLGCGERLHARAATWDELQPRVGPHAQAHERALLAGECVRESDHALVPNPIATEVQLHEGGLAARDDARQCDGTLVAQGALREVELAQAQPPRHGRGEGQPRGGPQRTARQVERRQDGVGQDGLQDGGEARVRQVGRLAQGEARERPARLEHVCDVARHLLVPGGERQLRDVQVGEGGAQRDCRRETDEPVDADAAVREGEDVQARAAGHERRRGPGPSVPDVVPVAAQRPRRARDGSPEHALRPGRPEAAFAEVNLSDDNESAECRDNLRRASVCEGIEGEVETPQCVGMRRECRTRERDVCVAESSFELRDRDAVPSQRNNTLLALQAVQDGWERVERRRSARVGVSFCHGRPNNVCDRGSQLSTTSAVMTINVLHCEEVRALFSVCALGHATQINFRMALLSALLRSSGARRL